MNQKILIVDDEPHICRSLEFKLGTVGKMDVLTAIDGEQAMALIEEEHPCLVFLDVMLPKKDGYEVCRWIKDHPDLAETHVIMLSARGQRDEINHGIDCGADEYMTKPFDPKAVLKRAREIVAAQSK